MNQTPVWVVNECLSKDQLFVRVHFLLQSLSSLYALTLIFVINACSFRFCLTRVVLNRFRMDNTINFPTNFLQGVQVRFEVYLLNSFCLLRETMTRSLVTKVGEIKKEEYKYTHHNSQTTLIMLERTFSTTLIAKYCPRINWISFWGRKLT